MNAMTKIALVLLCVLIFGLILVCVGTGLFSSKWSAFAVGVSLVWIAVSLLAAIFGGGRR